MTVQKRYNRQEKRRRDRKGARQCRDTPQEWGRITAFGQNGNTTFINQEETMKHKERLKSYDELPLVLDVADIQRVMGISRAPAYELVHSPGFPSFRSGRLIKVSKRAFFDWMARSREEGGAP